MIVGSYYTLWYFIGEVIDLGLMCGIIFVNVAWDYAVYYVRRFLKDIWSKEFIDVKGYQSIGILCYDYWWNLLKLWKLNL